MNFRSTFAKSALAGVAGVMALGGAMSVPTFAAAQSAGYYGDSYYDPCRRESTNRGTMGALLGGALGAAIGSNAAAKNARTEGALLGGALGALGGAAVGKNSAACGSTYRQPRTSYYDNSYYGQQRYDNGYYARSYDDDRYYDRDQPRYVTQQPQVTDGCSLAESPIYLPDGRMQKRFVRVCPDANGNYQVVD